MVWDDFVRPVQLVQLLKQIQFVIQSGQICDGKFQCLHISQRYLRSNKCETTLINLIKLSVSSPNALPTCFPLPSCGIYKSLSATTWLHLRFSQLLRLLASSLLTHFRAARCNMNAKDTSHAACSTQHNNRYVRYVKIQYLNGSSSRTRSIKWHLMAWRVAKVGREARAVQLPWVALENKGA